MALAIHQIMFEVLSTEVSQAGPGFTPVETVLPEIPYIRVRLQQYEPVAPLKNLKVCAHPLAASQNPDALLAFDTHIHSAQANYIGKYIAVRGTIVRVSNVKPLVTKMAFACPKCEAVCAQV